MAARKRTPKAEAKTPEEITSDVDTTGAVGTDDTPPVDAVTDTPEPSTEGAVGHDNAAPVTTQADGSVGWNDEAYRFDVNAHGQAEANRRRAERIAAE